ncbi:MAG: hypothetical protein WB615_07205 [Candidatus Tumulicola sp.]
MVCSRIGLRLPVLFTAVFAAFVAAGCSAQNAGVSTPSSGLNAMQTRNPNHSRAASPSILKHLTQQLVIGSTIDPENGAQNPYGLTIAPSTSGMFTAGDLVICNFNSKFNQQGSGKSIVVLHPVAGSTPTHISRSRFLLGCDALAMSPNDTIGAAALVANDNPLFNSKGKLLDDVTAKPLSQPWGEVFAQPPSGSPAIYESDARSGRIVRINLGPPVTFDIIAKNFPRNQGVPGSVLAPAGLTYDPSVDTLYLTDGENNTIVAIANVSNVPNDGIVAMHHGMHFAGAYAGNARIVYAGSPLNGPISMALLPNGNLIVGNTLDPAGTNLLIEVSPTGQILDTVNVDTGPGGALFGIAATGTPSSTQIYFNDDNQNNVQVLEQ